MPLAASVVADPTPLTAHALVRARQRGIDPEALACLLSYGRRHHDHRGAEIVTFDRAALDEVARREPRPTWRKAVEASSLYAVLGPDGHVITAGHRYRRVIRDRSLASLRPGRSRGRRARTHRLVFENSPNPFAQPAARARLRCAVR